jgi:hypothetical protein
MCIRDEILEKISLAGQPGCHPSNVELILKNANRLATENASELSEEDRVAVATAKEATKQNALAFYGERLARL